jgi:hypothetical protein
MSEPCAAQWTMDGPEIQFRGQGKPISKSTRPSHTPRLSLSGSWLSRRGDTNLRHDPVDRHVSDSAGATSAAAPRAPLPQCHVVRGKRLCTPRRGG